MLEIVKKITKYSDITLAIIIVGILLVLLFPAITEFVRERISRQICYSNTNSQGFIPIITLSAEWEQIFMQSLVGSGEDKQVSIAPSKLQEFVNKVKKTYDEQALKGHVPVLLTSSSIRPYVRSIIEKLKPSTVVMSQNEIHYKAKIKTLATI